MRAFTRFATGDDRQSLSILAAEQTPPDMYRSALYSLGRSLGGSLLAELGNVLPNRICVVCSVEDADSLAAGITSRLEDEGLEERVRVVCFWNDRLELDGISLAPILKAYREPCNVDDAALVVVKSTFPALAWSARTCHTSSRTQTPGASSSSPPSCSKVLINRCAMTSTRQSRNASSTSHWRSTMRSATANGLPRESAVTSTPAWDMVVPRKRTPMFRRW